ncbi:hypothetical protein F2P81_020620 [Scophthalmus maximus]|uniref:Uncharacterized protein n=1 Tax=Scophthalmus maximus TaxID=52904 RepID=A0A6A4S5Q0_SCOMX|nr:hypothetical protein F2P81_020620 [Scophthalmus maximus]
MKFRSSKQSPTTSSLATAVTATHRKWNTTTQSQAFKSAVYSPELDVNYETRARTRKKLGSIRMCSVSSDVSLLLLAPTSRKMRLQRWILAITFKFVPEPSDLNLGPNETEIRSFQLSDTDDPKFTRDGRWKSNTK